MSSIRDRHVDQNWISARHVHACSIPPPHLPFNPRNPIPSCANYQKHQALALSGPPRSHVWLLGEDHTFSSNSAKQVAKAELKELQSPDTKSSLPSTSPLKKGRSRERWSAGCRDGQPGDHGPRLPSLSTPGRPFGRDSQGEPPKPLREGCSTGLLDA